MAVTPRTRTVLGTLKQRQAASTPVITYGGDEGGIRVVEVNHQATMPSRLECNCKNWHMTPPSSAPFCKHVEEVLTKGLDGQRMGKPIDLPFSVEVTVFVKPALVATVLLNYYDPETGLRQAEVPLQNPAGATGTPAYDSRFIGFLPRGQGRLLLRSLVIDWLIEESCKTLPECTAAQHPVYKTRTSVPLKTPMFPEGFNPKNATDLADLYDLLTTGQCRTCNEDNGIPDI